MIGILFATIEEAKPFLQMTGAKAKENDPFQTWHFLSSDEGVIIVSQIGRGPARNATKHLIKKHQVKKVINVGIAGSTGDHLNVGDIFCISHALNWPENRETTFTCDPLYWGDLNRAKLITSEKPIFDQKIRDKIAAYGQLIDMEGAEVAKLCAENNIPCCLLKGVSDFSSSGHRDLLKENLEKVSKKLSEVLYTRLKEAKKL